MRFGLSLHFLPPPVGDAGIPRSSDHGSECKNGGRNCSPTGRVLYLVLSFVAYGAVVFRFIARGEDLFKSFLLNFLLLLGVFVNSIFASIMFFNCVEVPPFAAQTSALLEISEWLVMMPLFYSVSLSARASLQPILLLLRLRVFEPSRVEFRQLRSTLSLAFSQPLSQLPTQA